MNGVIDMVLSFDGPYLNGVLRAADFEGNIEMRSGAGNLWRIDNWGSDNPIAWCAIPHCEGMLGYWQRTVPEPAGIGLVLLLALAIMYSATARKRILE